MVLASFLEVIRFYLHIMVCLKLRFFQNKIICKRWCSLKSVAWPLLLCSNSNVCMTTCLSVITSHSDHTSARLCAETAGFANPGKHRNDLGCCNTSQTASSRNHGCIQLLPFSEVATPIRSRATKWTESRVPPRCCFDVLML